MTLNFDLYAYMHIPVWTPEFPSCTSSWMFTVSGCERFSFSNWVCPVPQRASYGSSAPALCLAQQVLSKAGKGPDNTECIRAGAKKSLGQPSVFLSVSEDSLLSVHCMKITFVLELVEVGGERRWNLWLRLRDACACGAWLMVQGLSPFHQCSFALCISIFTIVRAEMCLLLTGKPSLLPEAKEGRLYGAGMLQERKGSLPKGVR